MLDLQKATFSNRISAFLFDAIMFVIVVVGMSCIVNPLIGYDAKVDELEAIYDEYSERYGIDLDLTQEEYDKMTQEEKDAHNAKVEEANKALNEDEEALEVYYRIMVLFLCNITVSTLVAYLVLEFAIPLLLGNGQTLGKKIFGIGLMRADGVKLAPMQLFVRSILGKYTLETMIPVIVAGMVVTQVLGIVGIAVLLGIVILEVVVYFKSGTNSLIHDVVAVTICIDVKSQRIFETEEELIEYKEKIAADNVGKFGYGAESSSSVYSSVSNEVQIDDDASAKIYRDENSGGNMPTLTLSTITIGDETYVNTASPIPEVGEDDDVVTEDQANDESPVAEDAVDEAAEERDEVEDTEEEAIQDEAAEEAEEADELEATETEETEEAEETEESTPEEN